MLLPSGWQCGRRLDLGIYAKPDQYDSLRWTFSMEGPWVRHLGGRHILYCADCGCRTGGCSAALLLPERLCATGMVDMRPWSDGAQCDYYGPQGTLQRLYIQYIIYMDTGITMLAPLLYMGNGRPVRHTVYRCIWCNGISQYNAYMLWSEPSTRTPMVNTYCSNMNAWMNCKRHQPQYAQ